MHAILREVAPTMEDRPEAEQPAPQQPAVEHPASTEYQHNVVVHIDVRRGPIVSAAVLCELTQALEKLHPQEAVELKTDAFEGLHMDIMAWGRMSGHEVHFLVPRLKEELVESKDDYHRYIIVKKAETDTDESIPKDKMAIVISSDGLEDLLSPLGFALAGACAGMEVSLFFQGPAVRALRQNFKGRLSSLWCCLFSPFARQAMDKMGHAPPTEKLDSLQDLGAKLYVCHPSMRVFGVKESKLRENVVLAEYATFLEAMKDANVILYC